MIKKVYVKGFIQRSSDDKILVLRRSATDTSRPLDWDFPGGTADSGEDIMEAGVRETKEEVGIDVALEAANLVHVSSAITPKKEGIKEEIAHFHFLFFVKTEGAPEVILSSEHDQYHWVSAEELESYLPTQSPRYKEVYKYIFKDNPSLMG